MSKILFPIAVFVVVVWLFRKGRLDPDMTGLLLILLITALLLANNDAVMFWLAGILSISYVPLAIVAVSIGLLICLVIGLAVLVSDTRRRQVDLLRRLASLELNPPVR